MVRATIDAESTTIIVEPRLLDRGTQDAQRIGRKYASRPRHYFGNCVASQPPPSARTRLTLAANCRLSRLIAVT